MPWIITKHAVDRYQERRDSSLEFCAARKALLAEAETAAPLRERTDRGDARWKTVDGLILITKREKGSDWIVTVLTEEEDRRGTISETERELMCAAAADLPVLPARRASKEDRRVHEIAHLTGLVIKLREQITARDRTIKELRGLLKAPKEPKVSKPVAIKAIPRKTELRHLRHAIKMEADGRVANRCLRAALQAVLGMISAEEAEAYIRAHDPGFLRPGFIGDELQPPETRDEMFARLVSRCQPLTGTPHTVETTTED